MEGVRVCCCRVVVDVLSSEWTDDDRVVEERTSVI